MGFSIWQLLIILAIVLLLFGAKRLRNLGGDLGTSVKGFKDAMREDGKTDADAGDDAAAQQRTALDDKDGVIEGSTVKEKDKV